MQTNIPPWIAALNVGSGSMGTILRSEHGFEGPYTVMATGACSIGEDHSMCTSTKSAEPQFSCSCILRIGVRILVVVLSADIDKRGFHCITHRFSKVGDPKCAEPGGCTVFDGPHLALSLSAMLPLVMLI